MTRLLILGGIGEAVALAQAVADRLPEWEAITSLAGVTNNPVTGPGSVRQGGFGGVPGLTTYLRDEEIDALIDATHPFAATMAAHAQAAARDTGVPRLKLIRPMWPRRSGDRWVETNSPQRAAAELRRLGAQSVLITLGRRDLDAFADLKSMRFVVRMIAPPREPLPLAVTELVLARSPFTVQDEEALMRVHAIDAVVTKASGGSATRAKIDAARNLALPVVMLTRPPMPEGPVVETVEDAIVWLRSLMPMVQ